MSDILTYKCPFCGGGVEFDASAQKMQCPFCDSVFDREDVLKLEKDGAEEASSPDGEEKDLGLLVCSACGGEILSHKNTVATKCPYCGSPVLLGQRLSGKWKPDLIIPFRVTKRAAIEVMKRFASDKVLAPKLFSDENHLEEMTSVYVPFWVFDASFYAGAVYQAKKIRRWSDRRYNYVETRNYRVERVGTLRFRDIPVDASLRMPDDLMDSLEPFRMENAVPFRNEYLSGYLAEKYDILPDICLNRANDRIRNTANRIFRNTVSGYDTVSGDIGKNYRYREIKPRYALLPVWILRTEWEGKKFVFAMNGQTGKFIGELPMDKKLYWKKKLLYAGLITLAIFLPSILFLSAFSLLFLPVFAVIGFFAGELPLLGAKKALKDVAVKTTAFEYTGKGDLKLEREADVYLGKTLTKTRRDDD